MTFSLRRRLSPDLLALFCLLLFSTATACRPPAPTADEPPGLILISWDGAGDVWIDRLLEEGRLPHLAALAERGARAVEVVGTAPSKTAPSHASIYTGCGPEVHGVSANRVLLHDDPDHTVFDMERGFSSTLLRAEPLFVTTALEGLDTVVLSATQYHPHSPMADALERGGASETAYRSVSAFEYEFLPSGTLAAGDLRPASGEWTDLPPHSGEPLELSLEVADDTLFGLVFDHAENPAKGYDSVLLRLGSRSGDARAEALLEPAEATAEPTGWSPPFLVHQKEKRALLYLRLFSLAPDGSEMTLYRRRVAAPVAGPAELDLEAFLRAGPGSYDNGFSTYRRGRLGTPLPIGGDGRAEERLLETVAFDVERQIDTSLWALRTWKPDALFHYAPYLDQAGHTWAALFHEESDFYQPEQGKIFWEHYARIAEMQDRRLGALVEAAGDDMIVALVSDHGMTYVDHEVAVNRVLEEAGLLARGEDGRIDLSKTQALAAESPMFVRVNHTGRQGGIVEPEMRSAVAERAAAALLLARDPENGLPAIQIVKLARTYELDRFGGDLYPTPAPGYDLALGFPEAPVARTRLPWGAGNHGYWPDAREMHSIFYVAGPGVARGKPLPTLKQIDIAPTLSRLLGIRAPADACGRVVHEALAADSPADTAP